MKKMRIEYLGILFWFLSLKKILNREDKESILKSIRQECKKFLLEDKILVIDLLVDSEATTINLEFSNFKSFDELKTDCFDTKLLYYSILTFSPSDSLILDKSLNLNINNYLRNGNLRIMLRNINGFEINDNVFKFLNVKSLNLFVYFSKLDFYMNGSKFDQCNKTFLNQKNYFTLFESLSLILFSITVKFSVNTCPLIFKNSKLEYLYFIGVSNVFVKTNLLTFVDLKLKPSETLNSSVKYVEFNIYNIDFDRRILNKDIFLNIQKLIIRGIIVKIEDNLFSSFKYLSYMLIKMDALNKLFYKSSNWLLGLANRDIFFRFETNGFYTFPNEDFCLFKHFPDSKMIKISFDLPTIECSCTIFWLIRNKNFKHNMCKNLYNWPNCNFSRYIQNCEKTNFTLRNIKTNLDSWYLSEIFSFSSLIMTPIFCLIGFVTNLINIRVLTDKNQKEDIKKEMKSSLYKLMLVHSLINFVYCFLYFFHLFNVCITYNGRFCSKFNRSMLDQNYEIYIIEYLGGILKTMSNIICVVISIKRYFLLCENENRLKRILNLKLDNSWKKFFTFLAFFMLPILNIDKILTSSVNENFFFFRLL